mgnify:CR=1 FL=1
MIRARLVALALPRGEVRPLAADLGDPDKRRARWLSIARQAA